MQKKQNFMGNTQITLTLELNGVHFADDNLKCIFSNQNAQIVIEIEWSLFLREQLKISHHWFR